MLLAGVATLLAAAIQSTTGFGFALVLGPALFIVLAPGEAVAVLLGLGIAMNLLMLLGERRRLQVRRGDVAALVVAAVPGLAAGGLLLEALTKSTLQVVVGVAVLVAACAQLAASPTAHEGATGGTGALAYPVGLASGALTTSTSISGPPLVLWLARRAASPDELRDSLTACFLALNVLGAIALAVVVGPRAIAPPADVLLLVPLVAAGYLAGRRAFRRLDAERHRRIVLATVIVAGLASLLAGVW